MGKLFIRDTTSRIQLIRYCHKKLLSDSLISCHISVNTFRSGIQLSHRLDLVLEAVHDVHGTHDLDARSEAEDPAEELVAQGDVHVRFGPACLTRGVDHDVAPEAVNEDPHEFVLKRKLHALLLAAEHTEAHLRVLGEVELLELVAAGALLVEDPMFLILSTLKCLMRSLRHDALLPFDLIQIIVPNQGGIE